MNENSRVCAFSPISLPEQIETTALELFEAQCNLNAFHETVGMISDTLIAEITAAVNEAGKAIFPNEQGRKAEINLRLAEHEAYQSLLKLVRAAERRKATLAAQLERLRGEFALHKLARQEAWAALLQAASGSV